jgi:hypothetical protein
LETRLMPGLAVSCDAALPASISAGIGATPSHLERGCLEKRRFRAQAPNPPILLRCKSFSGMTIHQATFFAKETVVNVRHFRTLTAKTARNVVNVLRSGTLTTLIKHIEGW